jgi:catechol-2,3-dioxygenase
MKIQNLILQTGVLSNQYSFYCRTLGLRDLNTEGDAGQVSVQVGSTTLVFQQAESGWRGRYHFAIDIPLERYEDARLWLAHRAPALSDSTGQKYFYSENWNSRSIYFLDPAGNILELIARYGKGKTPAGPPNVDLPENLGMENRFSLHDFLCISEIGIASDNVEGAAAHLIASVPGLKVYETGEVDTFRALGDEDGLLILVRRGRIWYPETGIAAELLPVDVAFEMNNGQRYHLFAPPYPFQVRTA